MIKFELKKIWHRRIYIIAFILFIILDAAKIITSNTHRYIDSYTKARSELYDQVEGAWDMENIDYVVEKYRNASEIVSTGRYSTEPDQPGTVTGYIFGDFGLFSELYEKMDYMYNYSSSMKGTLQKAQDNTGFYKGKNNEYKMRESKKILAMYSGRNISEFYDTDGAFALISYDLSSVMIMLLMILALSPIVTCEKETEMQLLLKTSVKGGKPLITAKIIAAAITATVITAVITIVDIAAFTGAYGIKCFGIPMYSIAEFRNTPLSCTIGMYLLIDFVYKLLGMILMSLVFIIISAVSTDDIISFCGCFAVTLLMIFTGGKWSPISLMTSREMFKGFDAVNISGCPIMGYIAVLPVTAVLSAFLIFMIYFAAGKNKLRKFSLKTVIIRAKELIS